MDHGSNGGQDARPAAQTVYRLIENGELGGLETFRVTMTGRPRRRRSFRLTRQDVADYLERARIKPGELSRLHTGWEWDRYQDGNKTRG